MASSGSGKTLGIMMALCGVVAFAAACDYSLGALPPGATPMTPRAEYRLWWRGVEQCSGRAGSMAKIEWFSVPGSAFAIGGEGGVDGAWYRHSRRIVVAEASVDLGGTVRHEMLHAL